MRGGVLVDIDDGDPREATEIAVTRQKTTYSVFLADGRSFSGLLLEQTDVQLVLQDAEGMVHELPLAEIELVRAGLSAMPDGLADGLTREEMRDLIEYLAHL